MKLRPTLTVLSLIALGIIIGLPKPATAQQALSLKTLGSDCIETVLSNCRVLTAGYINVPSGDDEGAPMLAWQTQFGFTETDGVLAGFVLFEQVNDGWHLLDSGFDGASFQLPQGNEDGLLHIPGYSAGTGAFNVDRLYQWSDTGAAVYKEAWQKVDLDTWQASIEDRLPPGLQIWKGVDYDFEDPWSGLLARTSLWQPDDGNCCPTGGSAVITFEIVDHVLVVSDVVVTPPATE